MDGPFAGKRYAEYMYISSNIVESEFEPRTNNLRWTKGWLWCGTFTADKVCVDARPMVCHFMLRWEICTSQRNNPLWENK